jgi:hypothetical protein
MAAPTAVAFAPGANTVEIPGTVAEGAVNRYTLSAAQGQTLTITVASAAGDLRLGVSGEDGSVLKRAEEGAPAWSGQLPTTQPYLLDVSAAGAAASYTLRVERTPPVAAGPELVAVAVDAPAVARGGNLPAGGTASYVLAASPGQTMTVQAVGANAPVNVAVRSPGGTTWAGAPQAENPNVVTALFTAPEPGEYTVTLNAPTGATSYNVTFALSATAPPLIPTPGPPPERVEWVPGTTTGDRTGQLPEGALRKQYIVNGVAAQTMTINVTSDSTPLELTIAGVSGAEQTATMNPIEAGFAVDYQYLLPETGDYLVTLSKADGTPPVNYTIQFTVQ